MKKWKMILKNLRDIQSCSFYTDKWVGENLPISPSRSRRERGHHSSLKTQSENRRPNSQTTVRATSTLSISNYFNRIRK